MSKHAADLYVMCFVSRGERVGKYTVFGTTSYLLELKDNKRDSLKMHLNSVLSKVLKGCLFKPTAYSINNNNNNKPRCNKLY